MKKIILQLLFVAGLYSFFSSCSDMNDIHDMYLEDGERIYIGKIDSLKTFVGYERVKLRFWASDPRIKRIGFYWVPNDDSLFVDVENISAADSFDIYIGGESSSTTIDEGDYTLKVITEDNNGHYSIPFEEIINIYGDTYLSTLTNRILQSMAFENTDSVLSLTFSGAINEDEVGVELSYTNSGGIQKTVTFSEDEIDSQVDIPNLDPSKGISYRTMFFPEEGAIDTFYTESISPTIEQTINVALNKTTTTSDDYTESYIGANAVDGIISSASRWVSTASGEHWIEVDLGQEYAIHSFKTLIGSSGSYGYAVANFSFQAEIDGEWQDIITETDNTNAEYEASFSEVNTSRVRYYVPDYESNMVRLYEIEVYTTIKY